MKLTRRDFVKASSAIVTALGLNASGVLRLKQAEALEAQDGGVPVVWLQAQSCNGCSVSLLNCIYYTTIDDLLVNKLDLEFHPTLMAAAGNLAIAAAEKAYRRGGYVLVVEGAIPTAANGEYCELWPGMTALRGVTRFARRASFILAVGACASYGGMVHGAPNPTGAQGLADSYFGKRVVKIPSCPAHPDWVVGTVAYILANGTAPPLDSVGRPVEFFPDTVHEECPYEDDAPKVTMLGQIGCLRNLGCKGPRTRGDCPTRRWNPAGPGQRGVNWCIGAGSPCIGCTEPVFPDGMSPFFVADPGGGDDDD
jgi:hydrogenase small subunit